MIETESKMTKLQNREVNESMSSALNISCLSSDWIKIEDEKPPHEVVLGACKTYDCGWVIDTVWWHEDKQCWMATGMVESTEAHLLYTHWCKLPPPPSEALMVDL